MQTMAGNLGCWNMRQGLEGHIEPCRNAVTHARGKRDTRGPSLIIQDLPPGTTRLHSENGANMF